jgi:hypothetical protein
MKKFNDFLNESNQKLIQYGRPPYKDSRDLKHFVEWDKKGVKSMYVRGINNIMKSIYEPLGKWINKGRGGVMRLDWEEQPENWSKLNFVNSHYSALNAIVNWFNKKMYNGEINDRQFYFFDNDYGWDREIKRLLRYINEYKEELFLDTSSEIFQHIVQLVGGTIKIGDQFEADVIRVLSREQKDATNFRTLERGDEKDLFEGSDVLFDYNNKTYIIQVKPTSSVKLINGSWIVSGTSNSKLYPVNSAHYYAFCNTKEIFLFRNSNDVELNGVTYRFSKDLFVNKYKNN